MAPNIIWLSAITADDTYIENENKIDSSISLDEFDSSILSILFKLSLRSSAVVADHMFKLKSKFAGSKIFSQIDLRSEFYQICMHPDSVKYTAFTIDQEIW